MNSSRILNKIKENREELTSVENTIATLNSKKRERLNNLKEWKERKEEFKKITEEQNKKIEDMYCRQEVLRIANKILLDQFKLAFVAENIKTIKKIISPFYGKKYGEATKKKIREAGKKEINAHIYLYSGSYKYHNDEISIYPLDTNGFAASFLDITIRPEEYEQTVLTNNTIQNIDNINFIVCGVNRKLADTTASAEKQAETILKAQRVLTAEYDKFNKKIALFNDLLPERIERKYITGFKPYL